MIDIICYYDNHYDILFDYFFYPTYQKHLSSNFNLIIKKTISSHKQSLFEWPNWCEIIIERYDILKEHIRCNPSKWTIFSDIDIVFLNNFSMDILQFLDQENTHIAYMAESFNHLDKWDINGGFFLFKCSNYMYDYFDHIQQNIKQMTRPNDQVFIREYLLNNPELKTSILDNNIFLTNNYPINHSIELIKKQTAKVFHATSAGSLLSKIQILSSVLCFDSFNYPPSGTINEKNARLWTMMESY